MRRAACVAAVLVASGCAPSRSYVFDPVADAVQDRVGVRPEWRERWDRSPALHARIQKILASPLDAEGAALIAVLGSPDLQAAYAELGIVGGELASARTLPNPQVEAELVFPLEGEGSNHIELSAVENLTHLLTLLPRTRGADAELRAARRRAVGVTVEVAARARTAFYQAAAAEHRLALRRTIAEAATASASLARGLRKAGNITELALARESLFEEEAELAVGAAEAEATIARERLNAILGLHGEETTWRLAPALPGPPDLLAAADALESEAVTASLELEALRWRLEAAGQAIGVARVESFLPDLGVGVSAKRDGHWGVGPMVTLGLPLFDWGQGRRATAWAKLSRLQHAYTAAAVSVRAGARAARARLVSAHERAIRAKTRILPLRERLLDEALRQYNAMNLDAFELLVVRREHIDAEEGYVDALRDYWVAQTEVDQLRAGSLPGGFALHEEE